MFRNFGQLFYVTLPVAILLAFFYNPRLEISLFVSLVNGQLDMDNYSQALGQALSVLRFGKYWWVSLIAVVVLVVAMCVMVVKIDRHMRVGQMPVLPLRRSFGLLPSMLLYVVSWIVATELFMLIPLGAAYILRFVGNATAIVFLALGFTVVIRCFLSYIFALLIISFPLKYSENYRFNVALAHSARIMSPRKGKLLLIAVAYPMLRIAVMALAYLLQPINLDVLLYAVAELLCLTYVPCFAFKQYYDDVGGERRDVGQIMFG